MSTIPQSLSDLKRYLVTKTGREGKNFGIRGTVGSRRVWGYHLGKSDIYSAMGYGDQDYSNKFPRDRDGLSESSSAIDIKIPVRELKALAAYLVTEARAGRADLMEIIGPNAQGEAKRWAKGTGWLATSASANHEWHIHLGFPRDTEKGDRIAMFEGHLGPRDGVAPPPPPPEKPDPELPPDEPDPELVEAEARIAALEARLREVAELAAKPVTA